jgi:hypothetical protein
MALSINTHTYTHTHTHTLSLGCLRHGLPILILNQGREERGVILPGAHAVDHGGLDVLILEEGLEGHFGVEEEEDLLVGVLMGVCVNIFVG